MEYKIDLSWIKGEARNVVGKEIAKKLLALNISCPNFNDFDKTAYLFIVRKRAYTSNEKRAFELHPSAEVSVNSVLKGKWKVVSVKKPEVSIPVSREMKRGDTVLVRCSSDDLWREAILSVYIVGTGFGTVGGFFWNFCIPFDEKLLGKIK